MFWSFEIGGGVAATVEKFQAEIERQDRLNVGPDAVKALNAARDMLAEVITEIPPGDVVVKVTCNGHMDPERTPRHGNVKIDLSWYPPV